MGERALRGTRLGATSYENDRNTDLAPRKEVAYNCPKGHKFVVPLAAEAEVPAKTGPPAGSSRPASLRRS